MPKLAELVTMQAGFSLRRQAESQPDGRHAIIQISNLIHHTRIDFASLSRVDLPRVPKHHLIDKGDILFVAKGANNFAIHVDRTLANTVAASNFLVLRVKSNALTPAYVAWYLNQRPAQSYLQEHAKGSGTPAISKAVLGELSLPVPPLPTQRKVVLIENLASEEMRLLYQILARRQLLIQSLLLNATRETARS